MSVRIVFGGFVFPCAPETFEIADGSQTIVYHPTELGEVVLPRGRRAQRVSWSGWMPGRDYQGLDANPFTDRPWQDPLAFCEGLRGLMHDGEGGKRVLTIGEAADPTATGTYLSQVMFLTDLSVRPRSRDLDYAVTFVEAREFSFDQTQSAQARARRATPSSYAAVGGDTLFSAAARVWGDTARWRDLRAANSALTAYGADDPLPPGAVLTVPGGVA